MEVLITVSPAGLNRGDHWWHSDYILTSCWPILSGRMPDAFYLLPRLPLLAGNLSVLPPRKHHDRKKQLFLNEAQILKSMHNKHIVGMKAVCETPLAMMLDYMFFDFAPFCLEGRVSSLQDYCDYISAREDMVTSFAYSHIGLI